MKRLTKLCITLWALAVLLAPCLMSTPIHAQAANPTAPLTGMLVRTRHNVDFPDAPNQSAKAMRGQLTELCDYAVAAGYNAVFFEVRPEGDALYSSTLFPTSRYQVREQGDFTFFDPLRELIKQATPRGLAVYAVVDPYSLGNSADALSPSHPAVKNPALQQVIGESLMLDPFSAETVQLNAEDLAALAQKYDVAGILLKDVFFTDGLEAPAEELTAAVKAALDGETPLGLLLPDDADPSRFAAAAAHADLLLPGLGSTTEPLAERLAAWKALSPAMLVPVYDAASVEEVSGRLSANAFLAQELGVPARLVDGYKALRFGAYGQGDLLASLNAPAQAQFAPVEYAPATSLAVTRPVGSAKTTTFSSYYIVGTSDPALPLKLDGEPLEQQPDGVFGVQVALDPGENVFTFAQGEDEVSLTLKRTVPSSGQGESGPVTTITAQRPFTTALTAPGGSHIIVSCTAPSGAEVTAELDGKSVTLTQDTEAAPGYPASFSGQLELVPAPPGAVERRGPVGYRLNGGEESFSKGAIYAIGEGAIPQARVVDYIVSVFSDASLTDGSYRAVYKENTTERVLGTVPGGLALASGGFVKASAVELLEADAPPAPIAISAITTDHTDRAERFVLAGAPRLAYSFEDHEDGSITLSLYSPTGPLEPPAQIDTTSALFSSLTWSQGDDGSLICRAVPKNPAQLWGFDVFYEGENTVLYAKKAPKLSTTIGKPLEGVSVVLDPGHGGDDPGAPSVLGSSGPSEKQLNLATSLMLTRRLEQLGATVTLTRQDNDTTLTLFERMEISRAALPDFFISLHHNSLAESSDGSRSAGVEAYYYEPFGKPLGDAVISHVAAEATERPLRQNEWSYYVVTRTRHAPSILAEIAFMPNPAEYRRACDTTEIYRTANAISAALLERVAAAQ